MERWIGKRLRLRAGVQVLRSGPRRFLMVAPGSGSLLELGGEERYLLHLLQSDDWPDEDALLAAFEARFRRPLSRRNLLEFVEQLHVIGVLDEPDGTAAGSAPRLAAATPNRPPSSPDTAGQGENLNLAFDILLVFFGWVLHPICILPVLILAWMAANIIIRHPDEVTRILDLAERRPPTQFLLFVAFLVVHRMLLVDMPRALVFGMAARLHGGRIKGLGIRLWKGFVPFFHCDFGDTIALIREEGQSTLIFIMPWTLLAIGSTGTIAWWMTRPGSMLEEFWFWLLPPSLVGLVLSPIVFIRWSVAYLLLCKHFGDWRFHDRATAETRAWFFGRRSPEALTDEERYWLRAYGRGYYLFRWVADPTLVGLVGYVLIHRLAGVGLLLALSFAWLWWYDIFSRGAERGHS